MVIKDESTVKVTNYICSVCKSAFSSESTAIRCESRKIEKSQNIFYNSVYEWNVGDVVLYITSQYDCKIYIGIITKEYINGHNIIPIIKAHGIEMLYSSADRIYLIKKEKLSGFYESFNEVYKQVVANEL